MLSVCVCVCAFQSIALFKESRLNRHCCVLLERQMRVFKRKIIMLRALKMALTTDENRSDNKVLVVTLVNYQVLIIAKIEFSEFPQQIHFLRCHFLEPVIETLSTFLPLHVDAWDWECVWLPSTAIGWIKIFYYTNDVPTSYCTSWSYVNNRLYHMAFLQDAFVIHADTIVIIWRGYRNR